MFSLPLNIVPNFIEVPQLPATQRAEGWPNDGIVDVSLQLGEVRQRGTLDLIFENYPVKPKVKVGYGHDIDRSGVCGLDQAGWVGVWAFYTDKLRDGHLAFTIPDTHPLWQFIDYESEWKQFGLNGLPAIYRIIERPILKPTDRLKQRCGFTLRVRQSLRTPKNQ